MWPGSLSIPIGPRKQTRRLQLRKMQEEMTSRPSYSCSHGRWHTTLLPLTAFVIEHNFLHSPRDRLIGCFMLHGSIKNSPSGRSCLPRPFDNCIFIENPGHKFIDKLPRAAAWPEP